MINHDVYLGQFIKTYVAYSNNPYIRRSGASGGVMTELMGRLLDNKEIDGSLVVKMDENNPWLVKTYVAKDSRSLFPSIQSKYQPVKMINMFDEIKEKGNYIVVDKHCNFLDLKKKNKKNKINPKVNISYYFGVFCGFEMTYSATDFMLNKLNINENNVKSLSYRSGKWPGGFEVNTKDGKVEYLSKDDYSLLSYLTAAPKCLYCKDQTNELADISFGDAWFMKENNLGYTCVITRTDRGEKLMQRAIRNKWITADNVDYNEIRNSHKFLCRYKKLGGQIRINYAKKNHYWIILIQHIIQCEKKGHIYATIFFICS